MNDHVRPCVADSPKQAEDEEVKEVFISFATFAARGEYELALEPDDVIEVFNRENPKWWYGRKNNGIEVNRGLHVGGGWEGGDTGGREGGKVCPTSGHSVWQSWMRACLSSCTHPW